MIEFIVSIFALVLILLGVQTARVKRKNNVIEKQEQEIKKEKTQSEIYKEKSDSQDALQEDLSVVTQKDDEVKQKLKEAETDEEIIAIGNDIVDNFNRLSDN